MGFSSIEIAKKVFVTFDSVFHAYLMSGLKKYEKKITVAFFKIHFIRFEVHMDGRDNLKKILGRHII